MFRREGQHLGQTHDTADVVEILAHHGKTGVAGVEQLHHP
jgi:hypothetical protein